MGASFIKDDTAAELVTKLMICMGRELSGSAGGCR
jgi:hypothetical protein